MVSASVWFDPIREKLVFADGSTASHDGDTDTGVVAIEDVIPVPVADLRAAIGEASAVRFGADIWLFWDGSEALGEPDYRDDIALVLDDGELLALAIGDIPRYIDEDYEKALFDVLEPLAERHAAEVVGFYDPADHMWPNNIAIGFRLREASRPVGDLLRLAELGRALMIALRTGPLTAAMARELVASGHGKALEGLAESAWLDVKQAPYGLAEGGRVGNAAAWELAKDVAAFANAEGGIIVIPGRERRSHHVAVIDEITDLPLEVVNPQQYRDTLSTRVYPLVADLEVGIHESAPGRGRLWIYVPRQAEELKPFLVNGAVFDDRVHTTHVSIPRRVGADTRYAPIAEVHALLVAGRARRLGRDEILEIVRRESLPPGFRALVDGAKSGGLPVAIEHTSVSVTDPDGKVHVASFASRDDRVLALELNRVCEDLAPHGLATTRTSRGLLLPRHS